MTPLFDKKESCEQPEQVYPGQVLVLRSRKEQRAYRQQVRALGLEQMQGAHAVGPQVTVAVLGVAFACAVLIAAPISPVHALFTAKSATATNIVTIKDFDESRGRMAPQSLSTAPLGGEDEGVTFAAPGAGQTSLSNPKPGDKLGSEGETPKPDAVPNGTAGGSAKNSEDTVQLTEPSTPVAPPLPASPEGQAGSAAPAPGSTPGSENTQPASEVAASSSASITYTPGGSYEQ
jgi:hypothetical protein